MYLFECIFNLGGGSGYGAPPAQQQGYGAPPQQGGMNGNFTGGYSDPSQGQYGQGGGHTGGQPGGWGDASQQPPAYKYKLVVSHFSNCLLKYV